VAALADKMGAKVAERTREEEGLRKQEGDLQAKVRKG